MAQAEQEKNDGEKKIGANFCPAKQPLAIRLSHTRLQILDSESEKEIGVSFLSTGQERACLLFIFPFPSQQSQVSHHFANTPFLRPALAPADAGDPLSSF